MWTPANWSALGIVVRLVRVPGAEGITKRDAPFFASELSVDCAWPPDSARRYWIVIIGDGEAGGREPPAQWPLLAMAPLGHSQEHWYQYRVQLFEYVYIRPLTMLSVLGTEDKNSSTLPWLELEGR